jgi:putative membrane protein
MTMMGYGAGLGFGMGGWLGMLGGALLLVGLIVLVAWLIGKVGGSQQAPQAQAPRPAGDDALEVLRVRFARGEMTADEYLAAKQTLEAGR